jgi:glycosyltransferase involved in cell wall biosynthesis
MSLAYLVNQYPHVTHTFIRREIAALRSLGLEVQPYSIRDTSAQCIDERDRLELSRTRAILGVGALGLVRGLLASAIWSPARFYRGLRVALSIGRRSDRGVWRHLVYLAEAAVLRSWLEESGADQVHAHFATNSATVAMLCQALGGPPYSLTVHGPDDFKRAPDIALSEKVARARFVVTVSEYGRRELQRWCAPLDRPKLQVVRCLLEPEDLASEPTPVPDVARLVCVARLNAEKGHQLLLEALALLAAEGLPGELVLLGDGPLRATLAGEITRLGLGGRVRLLGWQSSAEVRAEMRAARAVVLASFAENLPVALMEAFAAGRPVIATRVGGVSELVEPGVSGWLVPPGSATLLAGAMREALGAPTDQLGRMASAGRGRLLSWHADGAQVRALRRLHQAKEITVDARPRASIGPTSREPSVLE